METSNTTEKDYKKILNEEEYRILRKKGTERAFTGEFWNHKEKGTYLCKACGNELFSSIAKYDSGTGWPSYYKPIKEENIQEKNDFSFFMKRKEVLCSNCKSHLGHVFPDGPMPTGKRYCINSASLKFKKDKKE